LKNSPVQKKPKSALTDNSGKPINAKGYRINPKTGDVIHNRIPNKKMFNAKDLTPVGEIPAPYNVYRYGFNPFELQGYLKFSEPDK